MNEAVKSGLNILKDIFEKHARYEDSDGNKQAISLDMVCIDLAINNPKSSQYIPQYILSFTFKDNAGNIRNSSLPIPQKYNNEITLIQKAIEQRRLNFDGC